MRPTAKKAITGGGFEKPFGPRRRFWLRWRSIQMTRCVQFRFIRRTRAASNLESRGIPLQQRIRFVVFSGLSRNAIASDPRSGVATLAAARKIVIGMRRRSAGRSARRRPVALRPEPVAVERTVARGARSPSTTRSTPTRSSFPTQPPQSLEDHRIAFAAAGPLRLRENGSRCMLQLASSGLTALNQAADKSPTLLPLSPGPAPADP